MSLLLDLLRSLGVEGQLFVAVVLLAAAMYAFKGGRLARGVADRTASGLFYGVVVLVGVALAIVAGWVDPNPGAFLEFLGDATSAVVDVGLDVLREVAG